MATRIDGRKPDEIRPVMMTRRYLKDVEGAVLIECGQTKVICTATVSEDVPPFLRGKGQGWVTAEYGMLPRSSAQRIPREAGKGKSGRTQEIQRLIGRALRAVTDMNKLGERTILVDCDVIQADAGTRTASITGGFVALADACRWLKEQGKITAWPLVDHVAAISVGAAGDLHLLDLVYQEDSQADVDMNIVMTGAGTLVEVQGTGEKTTFTRDTLNTMVDLAEKGIRELIEHQRRCLGPLPWKA